MCGISGICNLAGGSVDGRLVKKMCKIIAHRGPDDEGYYIDKSVALGCVRLSIIDLVTGRQPISNEDGSRWIVYNGECYNYIELRRTLRGKGHRFGTKSDTEVVLHAYEEYGIDFPNMLNGMFALAIYDQNSKRLLLARDRCGIKPLYYSRVGDLLLFSSEVKGILQCDLVPRELNTGALHLLLNVRYIPGEHTLFRGVKKLPPGHYLLIEQDGRIVKREYWRPRWEIARKSEDYWISRVRETLKRAVTRHLISDVPVGIYVSGGIDSSSIVAFASELTPEPLLTFCMGFGEYTDELGDARRIAEHFGTNHRDFIIYADLLKEFPRMIWYADMPKRNLYPYYISEIASKYSKVVLSGLGGDEIFGGYDFKYANFRRIEDLRNEIPVAHRSKLSKIVRPMQHFQTSLGDIEDDAVLKYCQKIRNLYDDPKLYVMFQSIDKAFDDDYLRKIYGPRLKNHRSEEIVGFYRPDFRVNDRRSLVEKVMYADLHIKLPDDFLFVEDATSMAHSLEARVPYLDAELLELGLSMPLGMKYRNGQGKYIFKKAMRPYLPKEVILRKKQGFSANTYSTYVKELHEIAGQLLPSGHVVREGLIRKQYVEKILENRAVPELAPHYNVLWTLVGLEIWWGIYMIREPTKPTFNAYKLLQ
jgi:asparagine synthase (glutamine-hydrolysing)